MRVRGAAGLLLAPVLWVVATTLGQLSFKQGPGPKVTLEDAIRTLLWTRSDQMNDKVVSIIRDGALLLIVVAAIVGLMGHGRFFVAVAALFQMACFAPWVYYDAQRFDPSPPEWLVRRVPWYPAPNAVAVLWLVVLLVVLLMAASRDPQPQRTAPPLMAPPPGWAPPAGPVPQTVVTQVFPAAPGAPLSVSPAPVGAPPPQPTPPPNYPAPAPPAPPAPGYAAPSADPSPPFGPATAPPPPVEEAPTRVVSDDES